MVDEHAPAAKQRSKRFDLQTELQRLQTSLDIDNYDLKPVPRPEEHDEE